MSVKVCSCPEREISIKSKIPTQKLNTFVTHYKKGNFLLPTIIRFMVFNLTWVMLEANDIDTVLLIFFFNFKKEKKPQNHNTMKPRGS